MHNVNTVTAALQEEWFQENIHYPAKNTSTISKLLHAGLCIAIHQ